MRICLILAVFLLCLKAAPVLAQTPDADTLDVINWNLEWWGSGSPLNAATQVAKTRQLMTAMNADVYAVCEVVNVDSFAALGNNLGNGTYASVVSTFGSFANNTSSSGYASAQKLGFIYRKSVVRNVTAKAMLTGSSTAYYNFASGRYPYLVSAEVLGKDAQWRRVLFIIIHAKADADATSCSRRTDGAKELKDSLDHYFPAERFLVLGDFNDDLDHTICSGGGPSNYLYMVQDSTHYKSITLPLERSGAISIDGYSSLIDNVVASDEMYRYYVTGSAQSLRSFVKGIYPNYDNEVSDHFPVRTRYVMDGTMSTAIAPASSPAGRAKVFPNPANDRLEIRLATQGLHQYTLLNAAGTVVLFGSSDAPGFSLNVAHLPAGIYALLLRDDAGGYGMQRISILH